MTMKTGTKVKIISGGIGALAANGSIGIVIDEPELKGDNYGGEYSEIKAPLYVVTDDLKIWGLCTGYKVEEI